MPRGARTPDEQARLTGRHACLGQLFAAASAGLDAPPRFRIENLVETDWVTQVQANWANPSPTPNPNPDWVTQVQANWATPSPNPNPSPNPSPNSNPDPTPNLATQVQANWAPIVIPGCLLIRFPWHPPPAEITAE